MDSIIEARRAKAAVAWNLSDEVVLIAAGSPIGIPGGMDQCFEYRIHPEYRWLAEDRRPGSILAFDPKEGWTRFTPAVTDLERIWDGVTSEPSGPYLDEFGEWMRQRENRTQLHLGAGGEGNEREQKLREQLTHVRRPKDDSEIELMKLAASATAAGHKAAREFVRPGITEREIQIELEATFFRNGADRTGYHSIVGTGTNSAVFHFSPGKRVVQPNDVVLIDAGAEVDGYVIDVTRTYPAGDKFTPEQQAIYDIVLEAEVNSISRCRNGAEWLHIHQLAALDMAQGLIDLGLMRGTASSAIESEAIALFLPHGIGHMVGLGVRDASGPLPGRLGEHKAAGSRVRCDLPLEPGYVMTVEPGLYFIPALLNDSEKRRQFQDFINWDRVEPYLAMGGMRIEDDILVTDGDPINLTAEIAK
jgi:Xaa-Pro aminopeptidase